MRFIITHKFCVLHVDAVGSLWVNINISIACMLCVSFILNTRIHL